MRWAYSNKSQEVSVVWLFNVIHSSLTEKKYFVIFYKPVVLNWFCFRIQNIFNLSEHIVDIVWVCFKIFYLVFENEDMLSTFHKAVSTNTQQNI